MAAAGTQRAVDAVVIGAGVIGAAVARSLAGRRLRVAVVERKCPAAEASGGNFGLVWVQSKSPEWYLRLTMASADSYPGFADDLAETGVEIEYHRSGALDLILSADGIGPRRKVLERQSAVPGFRAELLTPAKVCAMEPAISPEGIAAGVWSPLDGHLNPFALCRALIRSARARGAEYHPATEVIGLELGGGRISGVVTSRGRIAAPVVVNAAGLNVNSILAMSGSPPVPVTGNRGQVIVTEPLPRLLGRPTNMLRQTDHGNVLIGCTTEPGSSDRQGELGDVHALAAKAVRVMPVLARANAIRTWSSPRVWPADGLPILEESATAEGLYTIVTHSGISLCPYLGETVADWIVNGEEPPAGLRLAEGRMLLAPPWPDRR